MLLGQDVFAYSVFADIGIPAEFAGWSEVCISALNWVNVNSASPDWTAVDQADPVWDTIEKERLTVKRC